MPSLIGKILINRQLPGKKELLGGIGTAIKSTLRNPIKAFRDGIARDKLAVSTYKGLTGQGRKQAAGALLKNMGHGAYVGGGKDLLVNTGGLVGSKLGSAGGKIPELAGDWAGAAAARKALDGTEAIVKARKIRANPTFLKQPKNVQAGILRKRTMGYARAGQKSFKKELASDTVGWGIGNSSADALTAAGVRIPFKGAAVAMGTAPSVIKGIKVGKRVARQTGMPKIEAIGTGVRKGILSTNRSIGRSLNPAKTIKTGILREQRMTSSINKNLQKLPKLPAGTNFNKRNYFLSDFSSSPKGIKSLITYSR